MTLKRHRRYERAWARAKRKREEAENALAVLVNRPASKYGRACFGSHGKIETFGKNIHRCGSCLYWETTEIAQ